MPAKPRTSKVTSRVDRLELTVHAYLDPDENPAHVVEDDAELRQVCRILQDVLERLPHGGAVVIRKSMPPAPAPSKRTRGTK